MEENQEPKTDPYFDELMVAISNSLAAADSYEDATLRLTTQEVYEKLQEFYPSRKYTPEDVYTALLQLGYQYADPFKLLEYRWLFK